MKNWYIWILILVCSSCLSNPTTEKRQSSRSHIINIHDKITEIKIDSILLSGSTRAFIMNNYLIIADYKPEDKLIHISDKATFKYLTSTTYTGQGSEIIMALDGDMQYAYFDFSNIKTI